MTRKSPEHMALCYRLIGMAAAARSGRHGLDDVVVHLSSGQGRYLATPVSIQTAGVITAAQFDQLDLHLRLLLAGLAAEQMYQDRSVESILRPSGGYEMADGDVHLLRRLLILLTGNDDLARQLVTQKAVVRDLTHRDTWRAVAEAADLLACTDRMSAEALDSHFAEFDLPTIRSK